MMMRRLPISVTAVLTGALLALAPACDSSEDAPGTGSPGGGIQDSGGGDGTGGDAAGGADGLAGGDSNGPGADIGGGGACERPEDKFWVIYGERGRIPGTNDGEFDLFVMDQDGMNPLDPADPEPLSVTSFSLANQAFAWCGDDEVPLTCARGCFIDRDLKWIAVAVPAPTDAQIDPTSPDYDPAFACLAGTEEVPDAGKGFSLLLGKLDPSLHAQVSTKTQPLKNVADFHFAGGKMFYSKQESCSGPSCTYTIFMRDLEKNVNEEIPLFTFPPDAASLKDSTYKGHFTVSGDGEVIAALNPTIRSQSYWTWRNGSIQQLNLLCTNRQDGQCIGTGSEYTDADPVALSPDHTLLQTFTVAEGRLRAWLYHTNEDLEPLWSNLTQVPSGSNYKNNICSHMTEDWQYAYARAKPRFSPDGKSVYYLGRSECDDLAKPETDVLELPISLIGSGKPIADGDIRNITKNPKDSSPANTVIEDFDLCPGGKTLVLVATPQVDGNGKELKDDSLTAKKNRELFLIGTDGCGKVQMTYDLAYEVNSPVCVKPRTL